MNQEKKQSKVTLSKLTFHQLDWLEWITLGVGFWFLIYPKPYTFLFSILLTLPIVGLVLNGLNGRPSISSLVAITKDDDGNDKYDVADFIDFAALVLFVRLLIDFEFESFYSLLLPGSIAFVVMLLLLFGTHKHIASTEKNTTWIYVSLLFNVLLYSYSATYGVNCVYDSSTPKVYKAKVLDKSISKSKRHTSYYVKVTPWGHHYDAEEISVSANQYGALQLGETVNVDYKEGVLGIPWYYIE